MSQYRGKQRQHTHRAYAQEVRALSPPSLKAQEAQLRSSKQRHPTVRQHQDLRSFSRSRAVGCQVFHNGQRGKCEKSSRTRAPSTPNSQSRFEPFQEAETLRVRQSRRDQASASDGVEASSSERDIRPCCDPVHGWFALTESHLHFGSCLW